MKNVLISCMVTAQRIGAFVYVYAKCRFSHDEAQMYNAYIPAPHVSRASPVSDFSFMKTSEEIGPRAGFNLSPNRNEL